MLFPKPKFEIGQIVRLASNGNPDELAVVSGVEVCYYSFDRRHVWYYKLVDCQGLVAKDLSEEDIESANAETGNQVWSVTGGDVPIRPVKKCWSCLEVRVDDGCDCPYCGSTYLVWER